MRISMVVRDAGITDATTLYTYELPGLEVWLPDGATVSVPFGDDGEGGGITEPVARSFFSLADKEVHVELNYVHLDQPESWGRARTVSTWWRDSFDGTTRTKEEFSRHVHEGLLKGGWKKYTG